MESRRGEVGRRIRKEGERWRRLKRKKGEEEVGEEERREGGEEERTRGGEEERRREKESS